uniref:Uncharacterized protein n=1 Tax=Trichogramma kaykai TaxID=54128 RepID=A0ABD2WI01_9HYME
MKELDTRLLRERELWREPDLERLDLRRERELWRERDLERLDLRRERELWRERDLERPDLRRERELWRERDLERPDLRLEDELWREHDRERPDLFGSENFMLLGATNSRVLFDSEVLLSGSLLKLSATESDSESKIVCSFSTDLLLETLMEFVRIGRFSFMKISLGLLLLMTSSCKGRRCTFTTIGRKNEFSFELLTICSLLDCNQIRDNGYNEIYNDEFDAPPMEQTCDVENENLRGRPKNLKEFIESREFSEKIDIKVDRTRGEIFMMLLKFSVTYGHSATAMTNLFKLINNIFEQPILPNSKYILDKLLSSDKLVEFHAVCSECSSYIGRYGENVTIKECHLCHEPIDVSKSSNDSYFVLIDPSQQIIDLIQTHEHHVNAILNERIASDEFIEDIYDAKMYVEFRDKLPFEKRNNYITLSFNTDGAVKFENSKTSIWPIYLMINELPIQDRLNKLVCCGLWFNKTGFTQPWNNIFFYAFPPFHLILKKQTTPVVEKAFPGDRAVINEAFRRQKYPAEFIEIGIASIESSTIANYEVSLRKW